jgi:membrane protein required for colicin V production
VSPASSSLSAVDWGVLGILGWSGVTGFLHGFTREALRLTAWMMALWGTPKLDSLLKPLLEPYFSHTLALSASSLGASFLLLLIAGTLIGRSLSGLIQKSVLSSLDRTLGLPFGLLRGYLLISCALLGYSAFSGGVLAPAVQESRFFPFIQPGASWIYTLIKAVPDGASLETFLQEVPPSPQEKIEDFVAPRLEKKSPQREQETLDALTQSS